MKILNLNKNKLIRIKGSNEQPIYTKKLMEISSIYIKDNKILKNRGERVFDLCEEVVNLNNIIIEQNKIVKIYCKNEKVEFYKKEIDFIKNELHLNVEGKIQIISRII